MIIPRTQGDEDGLCGLYSILNAMRYLYPRMSEDTEAAIFKCSARALTRWPKILWDGTTTADMRRMLQAVYLGIPVDVGLRITAHEPFQRGKPSARAFYDQLFQLVEPEDQVAIIGLEKPYEHWTVAREVRSQAILLQDSSKLHEIWRHEIGLPGSKAKWQIDPRCTFLITRPT